MTREESQPADTAERLQAILAGDMSPDEAREVLALVAGDDHARRLAREMLALQRAARAAYGYDTADAAMRDSLTSLLASLKESGLPGANRAAGGRPATARRSAWRARRWVPLLGAAAMIAVSLYVAISAHIQSRAIQTRLDRLVESAALPQVTEAERAGYSRIWSEVAGPAGRPKPWILLSNGGGEFGYFPASLGGGADEGLLLVRCLIVTAEGKQVQCVNLLVPARRDLRLSLPEVGRLAGLPVACDLAMEEGGAAVGLTVGENSADAVGVRGRVGFGNRSTEIGQFRINGRPMRVVVQAVPLGAVG